MMRLFFLGAPSSSLAWGRLRGCRNCQAGAWRSQGIPDLPVLRLTTLGVNLEEAVSPGSAKLQLGIFGWLQAPQYPSYRRFEVHLLPATR
ncbi:hypothetical protein ABIE13_001607 [Ottowia thiooxydans]|uniref:Secreted protein n=1 Tax=Ottowia thiooxydans TaxID=219182 RepID=A0ABV2Q6L9_9BURK